jgi:hypothetical protein
MQASIGSTLGVLTPRMGWTVSDLAFHLSGDSGLRTNIDPRNSEGLAVQIYPAREI